ncbi:MAG TPA: aminomethyl-transferring glycine dehydrogenase subunit GcvPA [Gemmatales bacterium]|nr:aminomethyl-transferring glycine dehydrogenase subunit GcvPA [Gemmatales bacterium]
MPTHPDPTRYNNGNGAGLRSLPLSYILNTPAEQQEMLGVIGVPSVDALFESIPESCRLKQPLDLPPPLTELELTRETTRLADRNIAPDQAVCFLGGGAYDHFIPAVVDTIAGRSEYYTAYTPYQAEASQGSLQAFFEFQTMICQLTGMDVANASLYEGGHAVAEAAIMAIAATLRHGKVLVAGSVHPHYRQTLETYLAHLEPRAEVLPTPAGVLEPDTLAAALDEQTACVIVQHPNFFGNLEEVQRLAEIAHARGALFIVSVDPVSLGLLRRPGDYGADIVVAEGQGLGTPLQFGGPYLGIMACRQEFVRKMPGRLVGETTDRHGRRCWVLTLQTREQHIRREKATSNICTNQGLLALRATAHLAALGPAGLKETAELCLQKAHYAAATLAQVPGVQLRFQAPFFKEFVIRVPGNVPSLLQQLLGAGYHAGLWLGEWYPELADCVAVAVTEKRTKAEIDGLAAAWRSVLK